MAIATERVRPVSRRLAMLEEYARQQGKFQAR